MSITFAYFTSRKEPQIHWFLASLRRELAGDTDDTSLIVVDFWKDDRPLDLSASPVPVKHVTPKPCVWQGKHRIAKENWWAASNARNTAVCLAPDGWLIFVDDLSVLTPGYMREVREAMKKPDTISLGSYRKVKNLNVVDGEIISYDDNPPGNDNRLAHGKDLEGVPCGGNWLYGCSLVAPVEAFLSINGWPEAWCDPLSFEDVIAGILLAKKGWKMEYRKSMLTLESEEHHHGGTTMKRSDYGVSPNDKSHAVLHAAQGSDGWHPNYFGEEGIRGLRQRVLAGEAFPIMECPRHEWFTSKPIEEL